MSRKTQGKGMSRGMSPELIKKETDGLDAPIPEKDDQKESKLRNVPGLPRPVPRRSSKS